MDDLEEKRHFTNITRHFECLNPLNAYPEKWSNTLKQIVGNLPTICLSVFDHFMNLALKGLKKGLRCLVLFTKGTDVVISNSSSRYQLLLHLVNNCLVHLL